MTNARRTLTGREKKAVDRLRDLVELYRSRDRPLPAALVLYRADVQALEAARAAEAYGPPELDLDAMTYCGAEIRAHP